MECPYCRALNRDGVRFCSNCGRQLPSSTANPPTVPSGTIPGQSGRSSSLTAGTPLQGGRYIVKGVLGQGGMGAALLVTDKRLDHKQVVIKELISDSNDPRKLKEDEANFKREVVTLAHLDHPLIPNVTDNFDENTRFFMVQEYVEGENLETQMDRLKQPMRERDVLVHASELLDVLDYLARQTPPIVHRDIKPANIIIGAKDKKAHLVDFGIARADVARNAKRKQTSALGTPGYAPPEQYQGNADPRSDLYALGATLHHLLTNRDPRDYPPFNFPSVISVNPNLSPDVDRLLTRVLQNDPGQRYQSAAAMKHDVDDILYRRFGVVGYTFSGALDPAIGLMNTLQGSGTLPSVGNAPTVVGSQFGQLTPVPFNNPQTPLPPVAGPNTPAYGLYPPPPPYLSNQPGQTFQPAPQKQKHTGRNILLVLLVLLVVIGFLIYGVANLTGKKTTGTGTPTVAGNIMPTPGNGIGVTKAASGEYIGVSDGTYAFDINRPDGTAKQQAAAALKAGNTGGAQGFLQQAITKESNDAEALIYQENLKVLAAGGFHVTLVVGTMLTGDNVGVGRDDLQGAYVAQKTWNDGALLNGVGVVLLIANAGSQTANAAPVARQIVQAASQDASIVGVMGWPYSSYLTSSITIFKAAKLPVVSSTASSDLLTGISPYFFRVCPSNKIQGIAGAHYVENNLRGKNVVVFLDPLDAYSSSLANDFTTQFKADGNTMLKTEQYTVGKTSTVAAAVQDALKLANPVPDVFYFSGYASDVSVLLTDLPTTGPLAKIQIMGGDALYELHSYQSSSRANFSRLHFTSFTFPDVWDVLQYTSQKPDFFGNYSNFFDPNKVHSAGTYGWSRADGDTMLSYDATLTLLTAVKDTGKSQATAADLEQALTQLHDSKAIQGVSGQISLGTDGDPINKAIVILYLTPQIFFQMEATIEGQFLLQ